MSKDMWMFLAIWNGVATFYWYFKYRKAVIMFSDPKVLKKALEILKELDKR